MQRDLIDAATPCHALDLLEADHRQIEALFDAFDRAMSAAEAGAVLERLLDSLSVHGQLEHAVFYPALRGCAPPADRVLQEAERGHASLEECIAQLQDDSAHQIPCRARVGVLRRYVQRHFHVEESRLMPLARSSAIDMDSLGHALDSRRRSLLEFRLAKELARAAASTRPFR